MATVLKDVCEDQERREALVEWVRELTPMDVTDFKFISDPLTSRIQLAFREANGRTVSAYSASDGTLRFLAILAALLSRTPAQFYFFEEIDNGIHPSRLRLLVDLIERQTAKGKTQVVTTTHSPELLAMISDRTFENTSVICRVPGAEEAVIRRVSDLPAAKKLRESQASRVRVAGRCGVLRRRGGSDGRERSVKVLIIPEDFRNDQYILRPLFKQLFKDFGQAHGQGRSLPGSVARRDRGSVEAEAHF